MKKILMLFAAAALVLGAASCQKENLSQAVTPGEEKIDYSDDPMGVIKVYIKKNDTKMGFYEESDALYRNWEEGDVIDGCTKVGEVYKDFAYTFENGGTDDQGEYLILRKTNGDPGIPSAATTEQLHFVYAPGAVKFAADGNCSLDLSKQKESHIPAVMVASGTIDNDQEDLPKLSLDFTNIAAVMAVTKDGNTFKDIDGETTIPEVSVNKAYVKARVKGVLSLPTEGEGGYTLSEAVDSDYSTMVVEPENGSYSAGPVYVAALAGKSKISVILRTDKGKFSWITENEPIIGNNAYVRVGGGKTYTKIAEAKIGDTRYAIEDAFEFANTLEGPTTIELVEDCVPLDELMARKNIVLDLKGKNITCISLGDTNCRPHVDGEGSVLEIKDTSSEIIDNQGKIVPADGESFTLAYATDNSTLKISGGNISNSNGNAVYVENSKLEMAGGEVTGKSTSSSGGAVKIISTSDDAALKSTFAGGKIISDVSNGLYVSGNVELTISGGTISYTNSTGTTARGGLVMDSEENEGEGDDFIPTVNINGGEIALTSAGSANSYAAVYLKYGKLNVNGGKITNSAGKGCAIRNQNGTIIVNGKNHPEYVADSENNPDRPVLSNDGSWGLIYNNGGEVNLYLTATYKSNAAVPILRVRDGKVNILGGTYKSSGTNGVVYVEKPEETNYSPEVILAGATVFAENGVSNATYPVFRVECGDVKFSSGHLGKIGQSGSNDSRKGSYRALTISGGKFTMTGGSLLGGRNAIYAQGTGEVEIQNGEVFTSLTGTGYNLLNATSSSSIKITGGKFGTGNATTPLFAKASTATLKVEGGKFTVEPASTYLGTYTTSDISESVTISSTYSISGTSKTYNLTKKVVE